MKYIVIKKSELTRNLANLADSNEDVVVLRIPEENVVDAEDELTSIDDDYWISSDDVELEEGELTEGILLPKEAINA